MIEKDVLIIGAGPVGIFAAFQAGLIGMNSVIVDSLDEIGGQCISLYPDKPIYDIPSVPMLLASDLINNLEKQASRYDPLYLVSRTLNSLEVIYKNQDIKERDVNKQVDYFISSTSKGDIIKSKIVIIAGGAGNFTPNKPPLVNIDKYEDKAIFYSVKDKGFFNNKTIVIAGGGDSAVDWAISLAENAKKVFLVHRRKKFRAAQSSVDKLYEIQGSLKNQQNKLEVITSYHLDSIDGNIKEGVLSNVILKDLHGNSKNIKTDILIPFFGLAQELGPIKDFGIDLNKNKIKVDLPYYNTSTEKIYAIGDICDYSGKLKLILTGFAEASSALYHAYESISSRPMHFSYSTSKIKK
ncbi:MAG TPA: NAD(P)/FAD-dependent oxidoreductase [Candidatus Megaira endosymbiont of Hartmannula sinica]|nr:NAD(P)/FAD-dependent oxidoreductase [Candidatus Megaera endosymbiont of Hartmannula sinica]